MRRIKINESRLRSIICESVMKVLREWDGFDDEEDILASPHKGISSSVGKFRVKYVVRKEDTNAIKNKWGVVDPERKYMNTTELEEFDSKEDAFKFFHKVIEECGGSLIECRVQELKSTLVGNMWDDLRIYEPR